MNQLNQLRRKLQRHASLCLFALSLALIGLIFDLGKRLEMHTVWHQHRYLYCGLPGVISMKYHGSSPYATRGNVQAFLMSHYEDCTNEKIAEAINLEIDLAQEYQVFPADDKGAFDIAAAAFFLFGPRVEGLYYITILVILLSVILYFIHFRQRPDRCLVPVLLLGALYMAMPSFRLTDQLFSLTNPRVYGVVALISFAHLFFAAYDRDDRNWCRVLLVLSQVFFVTEAIHIRSSNAWMLICVAGLFLFRAGRRVFSRCWFADKSPALPLLGGAWVVGLLFAGFGGLKAYQKLVYPRFYSEYLEHHLTWHNIGIGFSLNPKLSSQYGFKIDDGCIVRLIRKRLEERHDDRRILQIFGDQPLTDREGVAVDYKAYEEEARAIVVEVCRENSWEVCATIFYYKPIVGAKTLLWACGFYGDHFDQLYLEEQASSGCMPNSMTRVNSSFQIHLFSPIAWSILLIAALIQLPSLRMMASLLGIGLYWTLCSAIPVILTYPLLHLMAVPFVGVTFCYLATGLLCFQLVVKMAFGRRANDVHSA